jgi:hypothetical protein
VTDEARDFQAPAVVDPPRRSEKPGSIYGAMVAVMRDMTAITKGKKNQQQGFMYRGIDDVYNVVSPLLAKHGIFMTAEIVEKAREERASKAGGVLAFVTLRMRYTFFADDGSGVSCVVEGEGMDSGDKATNKAMAIAHKYALLQTFCIPTEQAIDPDAESHEIARRPPAAAPPPAPPPVISEGSHRAFEADLKRRGLSREDAREWFRLHGAEPGADGKIHLHQVSAALASQLMARMEGWQDAESLIAENGIDRGRVLAYLAEKAGRPVHLADLGEKGLARLVELVGGWKADPEWRANPETAGRPTAATTEGEGER